MKNIIWLLLSISGVAYATEPVRVYGTGSSFEVAKTLAFREAVQYSCKNTVYTRREARNEQVTTDNIKIANGCNIDNYRLIDSKVINNIYTVIYDVWITDTNLSNGLKSGYNNPKQFDGRLHSDQLRFYSESVNGQNDIVDQVFSQYPKHAFNIEQGKYNLYVDNVGKPVIVVPYTVSWNKNFLDSVEALLENTGKQGGLLKQGNANIVLMPMYDTMVLSSMMPDVRKHYIYDESHVMDRLRFNMSYNNYAFMKIAFLDRQGNVLQSYCQDIKAPMYTFEYTGFAHFFYKQKDDNVFKVVLDVSLENIYEFSINPARSVECNN